VALAHGFDLVAVKRNVTYALLIWTRAISVLIHDYLSVCLIRRILVMGHLSNSLLHFPYHLDLSLLLSCLGILYGVWSSLTADIHWLSIAIRMLKIVWLFISSLLIDSILLLKDTVDVVIRPTIRRGRSFSPSFLLLGLLEMHEVLLVIALSFSSSQIGSLRVCTSSRNWHMIIWIFAYSTLFGDETIFDYLVDVLSLANRSFVIEVHLSHLLVDSWETVS
jgi:hypothetical protein